MRHRKADLSDIATIDWARLAAYLDGEGAILINENKSPPRKTHSRVSHYVYLRVCVTNTDPRLIRWLVQTFGGAVVTQQHKNPKWRRAYKWHVSCGTAEAILRMCLPYFVCKRDQADLALAFQETLKGYRRGNPLPMSVVALRAQVREQMTALRHAEHDSTDLCETLNAPYTEH